MFKEKKSNNHLKLFVIDDYSSNFYKKINAPIEEMDNIQFISLEKNIGRSKIRNMFIDISKFDKLLFIDCDCSISSKMFLKIILKLPILM